ncbi:transcription factor IIIC subunit delta N-term-domain-containing protein [Mycena crocata]|nr:transcription factor IIIC subunit delta N-term-domain-containing protein [Mycena crocata]
MASSMEAPIYSALSIPTVTSRPSLSCLQWSGDGQVFFLSKGSVYILTPDRGVHSVAEPPGDGPNSHVKWFSTMIDFNPRDVYNWSIGSQEWGTVALGSLDVGLRAIACSPSNMTAKGGCVAAILSSSMDLSLWHTTKSPIRGEWVKLYEVTPFILELTSANAHSKAEQTVRSQVTTVSWSSHADFGVTPSPCLNGSLLATGTRGGTLMLFRFDNSALEHVTTVKVSDEWITHLAFSPWVPLEAGESETTLAYGTADGSVGQINIIQSLCSLPSLSKFTVDYTIQTRVEKFETLMFQPDNTGITALSWILPLGKMVLVRATPGIISLWSEPSSALGWFGRRSLRLCTQKLSVGSSSLQPVAGLHYVQQDDALLVFLFDGSVHVIQSLVTEPKLSDVSRNSGDLTSSNLSDRLRSTFVRTERSKVTKSDVNRVSGMIPYDDTSVVLWIQESAQPFNFEYKYDVLHESTFVAAKLCKSPPHDVFLQGLSKVLNSTKASFGATPLHLLRPIFLRQNDLLDLHSRVLETLLANADAYPPIPVLSPWSSDAGPQLRVEFRKSLKQHLFGCNVLHSLRLRLSLADFCWRQTTDLSKRDGYGGAAQQFLRSISMIILRILCRHLSAVVSCLEEEDIPFLMRIAVQSLLPTSPSDIRSDAERLLSALSARIPSFSKDQWEKQALVESCPACHLSVYLEGGDEAVCARGHSWGRCSVTTFISSTPMVRTCVGCTRKAFLPPSCRGPDGPSWLPASAQSWVVEEFLESVCRCLFCGNNFSSFL